MSDPAIKIGLRMTRTAPERGTEWYCIQGDLTVPMMRGADADDEENAVRAAEQLVREAFRRYRAKSERIAVAAFRAAAKRSEGCAPGGEE